MSNECTRVRELIEADETLHSALDAESKRHTELCHPCHRAWRRFSDYQALLELARDERAQRGDLRPEQWTRLRSAVDHHERRLILRWFLQPSLGVAMVATLLWIVMLTPELSTHEALIDTHETADTVAMGSDVQDARPNLGPGSVISSLTETRELRVFGRHRLVLAPRTRATIVAWNPRRIVLNVASGVLRAVVDREMDGDVFELRTQHARARAMGTDYRVGIRLRGITTVRVDHGAVLVTDPKSAETRVEAGQAIRVSPTGVLTRPAEPSPPPAEQGRAQDHETLGAEPVAPASSKAADGRRRAPPTKAKQPESFVDPSLKVIEINVPPQGAAPPPGG